MGIAARLNQAEAEKFAAELVAKNQGAPVMFDAYGRRVVIGGHYSYAPPHPIAMTVVDIRPVLDRNAPPGLAVITLQCQITIRDVFERSPIPGLQLIALPRVAQPADADKAAADAASNGDGTGGAASGATPPTNPPGLILTDQ